MTTTQTSIQGKANIIKLEESGISTNKKTDWDEIINKFGILVSILTVIGFFISILVLIIMIYGHVIDFSNKQADLNLKLIDRISQLEGKLEILLKTKEP